MNYLAHILLSGKDPQIQVGNFIADAVKGSAYKDYPADIRKGILLHRAIDDFTDHHPAVKEAVGLLRGTFGRYSGVLVDMYFDYFLAIHFRDYSEKSLRCFAYRFYWTAVIHYRYLPERFQGFLWHFITTDRLRQYANPRGIYRSLELMARYKNLRVSPDEAVGFMLEHRTELERLFAVFFPELQELCKSKL